MRHGLAHRKLNRDSAHRKSLLRNLVSSLVINDRIRTTLPKAKEAQPIADKLVTLAKMGTDKSYVKARSILFQHTVTIPKLFDIMSKRYTCRPGGYTRILKIGTNKFDAAPMAILEYVDAPGDTKISLAPKQIPALKKSVSQLRKDLVHLSSKPAVAPRYSRHAHSILSDSNMLTQLKSKIRTMEKVHTKLSTLVTLPFLPPGHHENKWPANDEQIRVEKRVWIEPLPKKDKYGNQRSVIKVKRRTRLVKVDRSVPLTNLKIKPIKNQHLCI